MTNNYLKIHGEISMFFDDRNAAHVRRVMDEIKRERLNFQRYSRSMLDADVRWRAAIWRPCRVTDSVPVHVIAA